MSIRQYTHRRKTYKDFRQSPSSSNLGSDRFKRVYSFRPQQFRGNYIEPVYSAWSPTDELSLLAYLEAIDTPSILTRATQPVVDMTAPPWEAVSGPAVIIAGGGHSGGDAVSAVGSTLRNPCLIQGHRYIGSVWCLPEPDGVNFGGFGFGDLNHVDGVSAGWHQIFNESTCDNTPNLVGIAHTGAGSIRWSDFVVANLSRNKWTPSFGSMGGYFNQPHSNLSIPWASTSTIGTHFAVEFRHNADYLVSNFLPSAWTLHKTGGTLGFPIQPLAGGIDIDTLFDCCNGSSAAHGMTIDYNTTTQMLRLFVANGTGTPVVNVSVSCSKGISHYVVISFNSSGYSLKVDEDAASTGSLTGALSVSDASYTMQIGRLAGGGNYYDGLLGEVQLYSDVNAALSANIGAFLKQEYEL